MIGLLSRGGGPPHGRFVFGVNPSDSAPAALPVRASLAQSMVKVGKCWYNLGMIALTTAYPSFTLPAWAKGVRERRFDTARGRSPLAHPYLKGGEDAEYDPRGGLGAG